MQRPFAIALDIGTTTIQASLIDCNDKSTKAEFACLNEQLSLGHDIITRINLSLKSRDGLDKLQKKLSSSINYIIDNLITIAGIAKQDISLIAAVGNTAMYYFLLSLPVDDLAVPPYEPKEKGFVEKRAKEIGIDASEECSFVFLPNIGGFVGSDALGVILASGMDLSDCIDIGTNGEILLGNRDHIYAASSAAGPAFEGWHTSCGMRAVNGAIEKIKDDLSFNVIGGIEPQGICGSALVDITAILLNKSIINASGAIKEDFMIHKGEQNIYISGEDVRQVQLAKATFSAGFKLLKKRSRQDISRFIITGNFGAYLNKKNARRVGIVPEYVLPDKIEVLESGALRGVELFVRDRGAVTTRIEAILRIAKHVSLGQETDFKKLYVESLKF